MKYYLYFREGLSYHESDCKLKEFADPIELNDFINNLNDFEKECYDEMIIIYGNNFIVQPVQKITKLEMRSIK